MGQQRRIFPCRRILKQLRGCADTLPFELEPNSLLLQCGFCSEFLPKRTVWKEGEGKNSTVENLAVHQPSDEGEHLPSYILWLISIFDERWWKWYFTSVTFLPKPRNHIHTVRKTLDKF